MTGVATTGAAVVTVLANVVVLPGTKARNPSIEPPPVIPGMVRASPVGNSNGGFSGSASAATVVDELAEAVVDELVEEAVDVLLEDVLPEVVLPEVVLPEVVLPDDEPPEDELPDDVLPDDVLPEVVLPEVVLPDEEPAAWLEPSSDDSPSDDSSLPPEESSDEPLDSPFKAEARIWLAYCDGSVSL